jgi:hypothetical protein
MVPAGSGTRTTLATRTIIVMGSTDEKASPIFFLRTLFIQNLYTIYLKELKEAA